MASGNIRDPKKLSKSKVLSNADKKLQQETEAQIKKNNALDLQLKLKTVKEIDKETDKSVKKLSRTTKQAFKDIATDFGLSLAEGAVNIASSTYGAIQKGVGDFIGSYARYYSNVNTRLLGTNKSFDNVLGTIKSAVTGSRATNVVSVLEKLNNLLNQGIAFNVEQRAFLDELSSKIATTFNATNTTLLQIVRLNRADSTAAYLGMEAALTEFLNANFSDTNYLTQNINETVSASIYEATSQLGQRAGAEFEYVVQKWLGSFYESGVNASTIQSIAQGIGYLGSGNVNALTSNSQLSNLFIAAANNAGLNYSTLLSSGLNAADANRLLEGIYNQARTIATSGDQVARSQFASMFGMNISDLTAMMNMTSNDLSSIASNMYTYSDMIAKTEYELHQVAGRTSVKEAIDNTIANVMAEIGDGIASSTGQYLTYQLANMIKGQVPIPIPWVGHIDLGSTMEAAILGYNILASSPQILTALTAGKALSLNSFTGLETYGGGLISGTGSGVMSRTTGSATYYGTSDSVAMASGSVAESKNKGTEVVNTAEADTSEYTLDDLYLKMDETYQLLYNVVIGGSSFSVKDSDNTIQ